MLVIVTRPASAGERLFERLLRQGYRAYRWAAFDIGDAPDPPHARAVLDRLRDYDLAIFVSATAVQGAGSLMRGAWPPGTMIGAVGASTHAAIDAELKPSRNAVISATEEDQQSGSEAFWRAWLATNHRAHRVLLIRAQDGRDWLNERFAELGAQVDTVAVYSRVLHRPSAEELQNLNEWIASGEKPAIVFSSTEAITALDRQVDSAAQAWLRNGIAIACHPRISDKLLSNGYGRVLNATFDDDSIVAQLESIGVEPQAP
ncbi:MAG TPA: uroporphyrinogen-III synthase [Burkholderiaceae bacterium]|nr:uroporphyrinogen-III synthase [Burkholderiaceae bacterium]